MLQVLQTKIGQVMAKNEIFHAALPNKIFDDLVNFLGKDKL
jgi:hypothetical protein